MSLHEVHEDTAATPLVSICLVHYERPNLLRQALESVLAQTYRPIELVIVDDGSTLPRAIEYLREIEEGEWGFPVKVVRQNNKYLGAARNAGVRSTSGEYILFVDDDNLLMQSAVADFVRAAQRLSADVVTGVPYSFYHHRNPDPEFDGEIRMLPLGGCAEVGLFENCFGDANALVSRRAHEAVGGFHEVHGQAVEDWEFFAKATLMGLRVEVLPKPSFWYRVLDSGMFVKSDPVANSRRIAKAYGDYPISNIQRMLELSWDIDNENRFRMLQMAARTSDKHETFIKLADADPESEEARRLLLQFMVEQRRVQEALDFALHNDVGLIEHVTVAAREQISQDARDELDLYDTVMRADLDITGHVANRARGLYGAEVGGIDVGGRTTFAVVSDTAVVRAEEVCPTGAELVSAKCRASGQFEGFEACLVVCASGAAIDIDLNDLSVHPGVYASAWATLRPEEDFSFRASLGGKAPEAPHDVFLLARRKSDATGVCKLTWWNFKVEISRSGSAQKSVIRPRFTPRPLPERIIMEKGRPLTRIEVVPADLEWFVPGPPTTLHPIHDQTAAIQVQRVLSPGTMGAKINVSVVNDQAHPVQFGLWMHPNSQPLRDERQLDEARFFSGWLTVVDKNARKSLQVVAPDPLAEPYDVYIASRVVGQTNVWFCHALVHDIAVLLAT